MEFFSAIGSFIITPLYFLISVVLVGFHRVFGAVFGAESGASWALSIIFLTLVIRAALIPLFVKQIKSSRNMQLVQPKVKELQKKYGHDRERLAAETMALYKETGTNPFASCLPLIIQMPIFIALFQLINRAAKGQRRGVLTQTDVEHLSNAKIFGARIADTFTGADQHQRADPGRHPGGRDDATTFLTQRQLMSKNMPADALSGPYANQQKMLLYVLPVVFAVGGIAFPVGVLLYWTTSNLWTMCQQFYVIRNNPAPEHRGVPGQGEARRREAPPQGRARARAHGETAVAETSRPSRCSASSPRRSPAASGRTNPRAAATDHP